jgi:hypothetical protein
MGQSLPLYQCLHGSVTSTILSMANRILLDAISFPALKPAQKAARKRFSKKTGPSIVSVVRSAHFLPSFDVSQSLIAKPSWFM